MGATERQTKQEVVADPFQGLMDSLLPKPAQVTTVTSPYAQQLADVLSAQQAAYQGGNAAAQQAIVDLVVRQAQGQRAGIESKTKAAGGYNSAAQRLAKSRVDAEAGNKAALQVAQLNQADRNAASQTAAQLANSTRTQTTSQQRMAVSDVLKAMAIGTGVRSLPAVIDAVTGMIESANSPTQDAVANQLGELTVNGVTYDNPNKGLSSVLGAANSMTATGAGLLGGPVGLAVGGLVQKYGPKIIGAITNQEYLNQAQWADLVKANPQAVQAALQQAGLATTDMVAGAGAGMNTGPSAFNMPETSYSLDLGLPSRASPAAFNALSMTPAGELFGSAALGPGASQFDFSSPDYSMSSSSVASGGLGGIGGGDFGYGLDSASQAFGNDAGYAPGGIGEGALGSGIKGAGSYDWGGFGGGGSDIGSDIDSAQSDSGLW